MFWQRLISDRLALVCMGFILAVLAAGALAPFICPNDPLEPNLSAKLSGISPAYPLGTDHLGRCILSRLVFGIRTTVLLALAAMAATLAVGTFAGIVSGYGGRWLDTAIMRICDMFLSFPSQVMILAVVGILGPGLANVILASITAKWAWYTRMIRTATVRHKSRNHIAFSRVSGFGTRHIVRRHLLPDMAGEIGVLATLDTGWVILSISGLSFLNLGVRAPTPEWGMMLSEAKNVMITHPGQMLAPGLAILLVVAAFNFLGDSIQAALDPRHTPQEGHNIQ